MWSMYSVMHGRKKGGKNVRVDWLDAFLLSLPGVQKDFKAEWNWTRYMIGGKLFCAVCHDENGGDVYITMKLEPPRGEFLRAQYEDIIPGYYMNKTHWNSVRAQGSVPEALLEDMLRESYRLVAGGLAKKTRLALGLL